MDRKQLLNDAEEALRLALDGRQSILWTAMPCIVQSVNFTKMTIEAQPAIQATIEDENGATQSVNLPLLLDVPLVFPSAGGFTITLPIASGDEVLVVFASRCVDSWWQSSGVGKAPEFRMHDLSDGFAIPGPRSQPRVVPSISSTGAQIRNDAGTSYIEIAADGKIKLVSPIGLEMTGNLTVSGEVIANSATVPVHLSLHVHPGVIVGGANTGGPVG